jgi:hypothetical protein
MTETVSAGTEWPTNVMVNLGMLLQGVGTRRVGTTASRTPSFTTV